VQSQATLLQQLGTKKVAFLVIIRSGQNGVAKQRLQDIGEQAFICLGLGLNRLSEKRH
jgi:hypothetical protein